jgi:hypothetical protein
MAVALRGHRTLAAGSCRSVFRPSAASSWRPHRKVRRNPTWLTKSINSRPSSAIPPPGSPSGSSHSNSFCTSSATCVSPPSADDHDAGGNKKLISSEGGPHPSNLHHYWDVEFVERLGTDPRQVAASLIEQISEPQRQEWSKRTVEDWATEAFALARRDAYGLLPHSATTAHTRFRRHMPSRLRRMSHFNSAGRAFGLRSP